MSGRDRQHDFLVSVQGTNEPEKVKTEIERALGHSFFKVRVESPWRWLRRKREN